MTDEVGGRKLGRRRRTTRRLMRRPARLPGEPSPHELLTLPGEDVELDTDDPLPADESNQRRSSDFASVLEPHDPAVEPDGASGVVRAPSEPPLDAATNPQIRLADLAARRTRSAPPPPADDVGRASEPDFDTNPRIERPKSAPPRADEADVDTNPRIALPVEDEPAPIVVVTRARVISDRPLAADLGEPSHPRVRKSPAPPPSVKPPPAAPPAQEPEVVVALDLDEGDASAGQLEIPVLAGPPGNGGASRVVEPAVRASKAPPPPPSGALSVQARKPASVVQPPPPPAPAAKKPAAPAASPAPKSPKRRSWWEDFFSDDYLQSVRRPTAAQIGRQVDFIEASLGLSRGSAVLDVGCGVGLHALELARRGHVVVAVDLSLPMITRAAEEAQQQGLRVNFMHGDMRELSFDGAFDAVLCVGTTLGFFDEDGNREALARMVRALKPGGKLLLDVVNRDHVIHSQPNLVWFEGDGCVVMEESDFNYFTSRLGVKRTMMRDDGRQTEAEYTIRLYSLHELGQLLLQAGVRVTEVSGQEATRGVFFGSYSARMILAGERRAENGKPPATP